jgi:GNAT superfamily N-acetyltransferase
MVNATSEPLLSVVDAESPGALGALTAYFRELSERFPEGFDATAALEEAADAYNPPRGAFVVAGDVDRPIACGAVTFLDDERGEIKRMWVAPAHRGRGLASRLLSFLEQLIVESGRATVLLDTNRVLTEAVALYRRRGYEPVARYNDNPHAHHWFSKVLTAGP